MCHLYDMQALLDGMSFLLMNIRLQEANAYLSSRQAGKNSKLWNQTTYKALITRRYKDEKLHNQEKHNN
jgi:hypothetical protein